jgi:hypothetical protein
MEIYPRTKARAQRLLCAKGGRLGYPYRCSIADIVEPSVAPDSTPS